jgi:hypothetical protein
VFACLPTDAVRATFIVTGTGELELMIIGWLVGSLFNDAFSVTRLYSVNDSVIIE